MSNYKIIDGMRMYSPETTTPLTTLLREALAVNKTAVINNSIPHGTRKLPAWEYSLIDVEMENARLAPLHALLIEAVGAFETILEQPFDGSWDAQVLFVQGMLKKIRAQLSKDKT